LVLSKPAPQSLDAVISDLVLQLQAPISISTDRMKISMSGALPETAIKAIIEPILADLKK
jgi:hypothetical protein